MNLPNNGGAEYVNECQGALFKCQIMTESTVQKYIIQIQNKKWVTNSKVAPIFNDYKLLFMNISDAHRIQPPRAGFNPDYKLT